MKSTKDSTKDSKDSIEDYTKDFIKDGLTSNEIREKIKYIRNYLVNNGNSASFEEKIKYLEFTEESFAKRYPMLFDMATRDEFNYTDFNYFMNMRDNIINDTMTFDNASKEIGKTWFDKYVDKTKLNKKK